MSSLRTRIIRNLIALTIFSAALGWKGLLSWNEVMGIFALYFLLSYLFDDFNR